METFLEIMLYSILVLVGLSVVGGALVASTIWLVDNSEQEGH